MTDLNDGVAAIKKCNGELYGFLEDATGVVADDEVNNEISSTLCLQVALALHHNQSLLSYFTRSRVHCCLL